MRWLVAGMALWSGLAGCAWIDAEQRLRVYRPTPGTMSDWQSVTGRDEAFWIEVPPARPGEPAHRLRALWLAQGAPAAPTVLYLHGTFRNVFQNRPKIAAIYAAGFSVLAVDYRGWGESTSVLPSEASIMQDTELAWAELARRSQNPHSRVIFGHSMGSGAAVELALRHREPPAYGALVLESAMTSLPDMLRDYNALGVLLVPLVTQQFASGEKIDRIGPPKWFLSGTADNLVPTRQTQALFDAAQGEKHIVLFEGGSHSGLHKEFEQRYQAVWREVAETLREEGSAKSAAVRP